MTPDLATLIERLTPNDAKVLRALDDCYDDYAGGGFSGFAGIVSRTGLNRRQVRLSCRRLKRKGLAQYARGLWNDDGQVAGAGYGLTEVAHKTLRARLELSKGGVRS